MTVPGVGCGSSSIWSLGLIVSAAFVLRWKARGRYAARMPPHDLYPGATEPIWYGDRKVYSVTGFNHGVKKLVSDLPMFWVEGEVSELRHTSRYSLVYLTLKDPNNGFMLSGTMPRGRFEALGLNIQNGDLIQ